MFVVLEKAYEYNDEIYHEVDSDNCGKPVKIFEKKVDANKHCKELTREYLKRNNLSDYGYSFEDIFDCSPQDLTDLTGFDCENCDWWDFPDFEKFATLSDADLDKVIEQLHREFYIVVEVK